MRGYFQSHKNGSIYEKIAYNFFWPVANEIRKVSLRDKYFSTINCIVRKSLWKTYPFDENLSEILPESKGYGGEDYDWAQEMRARGYGIVLDTRFNVYHSHGQTLPEILTRNLKWHGIRREIDFFKRPRKSYTRLEIFTAV